MTVTNGLSEFLRLDTPDGAPGQPVAWELLDPGRWENDLADRCRAMLASRDKLVLCLTGKAGSGKSTLGRIVRKRGLPGIDRSSFLVIDDGVAHVKWLGIFPRRIRHRCREKDFLAPFAALFAGKRLLVYVNATPELRIDRCDMLVRLRCNDAQRLGRLQARDPDGSERFAGSQGKSDEARVLADHYFDLESDRVNLQQLAGRRW